MSGGRHQAMTDLAKAVAFARHCLKWDDAFAVSLKAGIFRPDVRSGERFFPTDALSLITCLQQFLGKRYFMQINRGMTGLFQWKVIVGQQGLNAPGASFNHAQAENEDLLDAVFDACVEAARTDQRQSHGESRCASLEPEQDARQRGGSHES
jgi:hypothetical protein